MSKKQFFIILLLLSSFSYLSAFETKSIGWTLNDTDLTYLQQHREYVYYYYNNYVYKVKKDTSLFNDVFETYQEKITSFCWDKSDTIWVGLNSGLYFSTLNGKTSGFYESTGIDIGNKITAIAIDSNNAKWIASSKGIYAIYENLGFLQFDIKDSVIKGNVNQIVVDRENNKYFICDNHFYKYDDDKIEVFDSSNVEILKKSKKINFINFDKDNFIYIATDAGTYCTFLHYNEITFYILDTEFGWSPQPTNMHNAIDFDWDRNLLIGMGNCRDKDGKGGIAVISPSSFVTISTIFPYGNIKYLSVDENNNIWGASVYYDGPPEYGGYQLNIFVTNYDRLRFTGVNEGDQLESFLFPNPAQDVLNLTNIPDGAIEYEIINQYGVPQLKGFVSEQIDVSQLPAGIYFLKLNNQTTPIKFIKL